MRFKLCIKMRAYKCFRLCKDNYFIFVLKSFSDEADKFVSIVNNV